MNKPIIIIGAGVSGLRAASLLQTQGVEYMVFEARDRTGGRILSKEIEERPDLGRFDLGPTWFWPQRESVIKKLADELNLETFEQFTEGAILFEQSEAGPVQRHQLPEGAIEKSTRIRGGMGALAEALVQKIPANNIQLSARVTKISKDKNGEITVKVIRKDGSIDNLQAKTVIFALPPRLMVRTITFSPALSDELRTSLLSVPTWMAGQAKALAIYEQPFWRRDGLSGQGMSRVGPLQEIHDASPESGAGALFGFFGMSPKNRQEVGEERILEMVVEQLTRMYGSAAANPLTVLFKDWSNDSKTSVEEDSIPLNSFPAYGPPGNTGEWGDSIQFAGTENCSYSGGHIEGALRSAERAVVEVLREK